MASYQYKEILNKAKECKTGTEKEYALTISSKYGYYFAKAIINLNNGSKKDITKISFDKAPNSQGTMISRQASKADYIKIAKSLITYVEKHKRLPNYISYANHKIRVGLYCYVFAKILVFYNTNNRLPNKVNINHKVFTKPTETGNVVYDYTTKKYGKSFKTIDELLTYVKSHFTYQHYFDDHKSNKEVTDSKRGNCTDLLQWSINNAKAMGYEAKCIHVKCKSSGEGHVFGKFKHAKHTGGKWITRDIACVANGGSITCVWCSNGTVQAENPKWFMQNLNR